MKSKATISKKDLKDILISLLYLFGGFSIYWTYHIYKQTLLDYWIIIIIWIGISRVFIPISKKYILNYYQNTSGYNISLFSLTGVSSHVIFILLTLNLNITLNNSYRIVTTTIIDSGYLNGKTGCKNIYALTEIDGLHKYFYYNCGFSIKDFSSITTCLKKGLFGIEFIESHKLNETK